MGYVISGFYRCPQCQKMHTYSNNVARNVTCQCGEVINQFEVAQNYPRRYPRTVTDS